MTPLSCALTSIAPAPKKDGAQAIGRSRGGLTTKIHALVDALGNPVEVMLSPGQDHDLTCAEPLIEAVDPGALIADKAFDADAFIAALNDRAIAPVIPSKSNRKTPRPCDFALYSERNLIERFFNKLKHFRAIATRYDKLAKIFLAGVHLACAAILNTGPNLPKRGRICPLMRSDLRVWLAGAASASCDGGHTPFFAPPEAKLRPLLGGPRAVNASAAQ